MERRVKSIHLFLGITSCGLRVVNRKYSFFITRTMQLEIRNTKPATGNMDPMIFVIHCFERVTFFIGLHQ